MAIMKKLIKTVIYITMLFLISSETFSNEITSSELATLGMFYDKPKLYVTTPTRSKQIITNIAENITIITAKDIEEMNAHSVAEVLNRVPGLFIDYSKEFGAYSLIGIQGSDERHVLVLLDGVRTNFLASGAAETSFIPVEIISRIEIIKGPASSSWGSALGGVINIITKDPGEINIPLFKFTGSSGFNHTQDYRLQVSQSSQPLETYVYGGYQSSDGLFESRYYESSNVFGKAKIVNNDILTAKIAAGYSRPYIKFGINEELNVLSTGNQKVFYISTDIEFNIDNMIAIQTNIYTIRQETIQEINHNDIKREKYLYSDYNDKINGCTAKYKLKLEQHSIVIGFDYEKGRLQQHLKTGELLQSFGLLPNQVTIPQVESWAFYANDTIVINKLSILPGIRYDNNSVSGSFLSPSIGMTYRITDAALFRLSASEGFTMPPLSWSSGGGLLFEPNPSLKPEEVTSVQLGGEYANKHFLTKLTLFNHDIENMMIRELYGAGPPTFYDIYKNGGSVNRKGIEVEMTTAPIYGISLMINTAYSKYDPKNIRGTSELSSTTIGIKYDQKKKLYWQLYGNIIDWDNDDIYQGSYSDAIWDMNIIYNIYDKKQINTKLFLTVHNLFDGDQYSYYEYKNPGTWVEGGFKISYK